MSLFFAFGPEPDGTKLMINIDQIREIIITAADHCTVRFSETDKTEFIGSSAVSLLNAIIERQILSE